MHGHLNFQICFNPSLTSALNVGRWLAPRAGRFTPGRISLERKIYACEFVSLSSNTCESLHGNDSQRLTLPHRSQTKHFHGSIPSNIPLDLLTFPPPAVPSKLMPFCSHEAVINSASNTLFGIADMGHRWQQEDRSRSTSCELRRRTVASHRSEYVTGACCLRTELSVQ